MRHASPSGEHGQQATQTESSGTETQPQATGTCSVSDAHDYAPRWRWIGAPLCCAVRHGTRAETGMLVASGPPSVAAADSAARGVFRRFPALLAPGLRSDREPWRT